MVVQFQCAFCKQPIEVDDEFASTGVGCPYCNKVVNAPAQSTLGGAVSVPLASPIREYGGSSTGRDRSTAPAAPPRNVVAVAAFVLACTLLVALVVTGAILAAHPFEVKDLSSKLQNTGGGFKSQLDAVNDFMQERGGVPPTWLLAAGFLQLTSWAVCLAAVICALIGVRSSRRRGFAVAALAICAVYMILSCGQMLL